MSLGLVGRKVGMTRIFAEDGASIPVTVLDVSNNRVTQVKTPETDGYAAIQVTFGKRRASRVHQAWPVIWPRRAWNRRHVLKEFRVEADQLASFKAGDQVAVTIFAEGQKVDVTGTSIGKGLPGGIRRHNFSSNRASRQLGLHNAPGSIGMAQDPGRVFPGASAWPAIWARSRAPCRA